MFVVGGRAFTSVILQKNCTEFIAYENLIGRRGSSSRGGASKDVKDAMPLVKRALKVLADREVTPQLGVLKSTLLQLDSTFSEREYGVSTFRDFVQKTGAGRLRRAEGERAQHPRRVARRPRRGRRAGAARTGRTGPCGARHP